MSSFSEEYDKIKIGIISKRVFVWNQKHVDLIRKQRMLGLFVGPLPKFHNKPSDFGFPLMLMDEEAKLLQELRIAEIVEWPALNEKPTAECIAKWKDLEAKKTEEENTNRKESRINEIKLLAPKILEGKKKKQEQLFAEGSSSIELQEITLDKLMSEMIDSVQQKEMETIVQIFYEHPFLSDFSSAPSDWTFPNSDEEKLRYKVYKDLWHRHYYVICGHKFGGDYLVYQGDPDTYHACFIVSCIRDDQPIHKGDFVTKVRIGSTTKKVFVWASIDEKDHVHYISCQWPGKYFEMYDD